MCDHDALGGHQLSSKHVPAYLSVMMHRVHWAGTSQNYKFREGGKIMQSNNGSKSEETGKQSKDLTEMV